MSLVLNSGFTIGPGVVLDGSSSVPPVITSNLVLYLDARDYAGTGPTWTSRLGSDATLYHSPTREVSGPGYFTFVPTFKQYAEVPWIGNLSNWTVEAWFRTSAVLSNTNAIAVVCTTYDDPETGQYYGNLNYCIGNNSVSPFSNNNLQAGYFNGNWHETEGYTPTVSQWVQMVARFDGSTLASYVNGETFNVVSAIGSSTANGAPTRIARRWDGVPSNPNQYGYDATANYFPGDISVVRIYDAALSTEQIAQNFEAERLRFGL